MKILRTLILFTIFSNASPLFADFSHTEMLRVGIEKSFFPLELTPALESLTAENFERACKQLENIKEKVRRLKNRVDRKQETAPLAEEIFAQLKQLAPDFLTVYFNANKAAVHAL